jgi:hypothetical protein
MIAVQARLWELYHVEATSFPNASSSKKRKAPPREPDLVRDETALDLNGDS